MKNETIYTLAVFYKEYDSDGNFDHCEYNESQFIGLKGLHRAIEWEFEYINGRRQSKRAIRYIYKTRVYETVIFE